MCDTTQYANLARDDVVADLQSAAGPSFSHGRLLPFSAAGYMNTLRVYSPQYTECTKYPIFQEKKKTRINFSLTNKTNIGYI